MPSGQGHARELTIYTREIVRYTRTGTRCQPDPLLLHQFVA